MDMPKDIGIVRKQAELNSIDESSSSSMSDSLMNRSNEEALLSDKEIPFEVYEPSEE